MRTITRDALCVLTVLAVLALAAACGEESVIPRQEVAGGNAERGERAIVAHGCGSCHVIPGVAAATGTVGPPLTALADRTFLAGAIRNDAETLVAWIREPQRLRPGGVMPDLGVSEADARDIAAYLYTLSGNRLGPPHPITRSVLPAH